MPDRARRVVSFVLAMLAVFSVGRVLYAYASRPSRWSKRFALSANEVSPNPSVLSTEGIPGAADFALLAGYRATMATAIVSGDICAYVGNFSVDAVTLTASGVPIVGAEAIARGVRRTLERASVVDSGLMVTSHRAVGRDIFEEGDFYIQLRVGEADVLSKGRFATLWNREMGQWRIVFEAVRANENEIVEA